MAYLCQKTLDPDGVLRVRLLAFVELDTSPSPTAVEANVMYVTWEDGHGSWVAVALSHDCPSGSHRSLRESEYG